MTLRTPPERYIVYDPEDRYHASICVGEDDARDIALNYFKSPGIRIERISLGDTCIDVTAEILPDTDEPDEYPEADLKASIADRRHQLHMEGAI